MKVGAGAFWDGPHSWTWVSGGRHELWFPGYVGESWRLQISEPGKVWRKLWLWELLMEPTPSPHNFYWTLPPQPNSPTSTIQGTPPSVTPSIPGSGEVRQDSWPEPTQPPKPIWVLALKGICCSSNPQQAPKFGAWILLTSSPPNKICWDWLHLLSGLLPKDTQMERVFISPKSFSHFSS